MSSNSIKVEANTSVEVEKSSVKIEPVSSLPIVITPTTKVTAHPRSYSIVGNDVYTIKRNSELEPWFEDQINNLIDSSDLADEVSDLDNRFTNFEDGVTLEIGYLQTADEKLAYDLSVLKTSTDNNTAGIQNLNIVKVTEDEATAIANTTIGAWQNGAGGAWFDEKVAVVSNVAYSAAKSASTLTASIDSQADQITAIIGDIDNLEKQVDGVVETFFVENTGGNIGPNLPNSGNIDLTAEPYATWNADGTKSLHTGDTYVLYEEGVDGKEYLSSWRFGLSAVNEPETDSEGYIWIAVTDSKAEEAYQLALQAQGTADGKSVVYYQESFPYPSYGPTTSLTVKTEQDKLVGDVLVESDNDNKMWRYNRIPTSGGNDDVTSVTYVWGAVDDTRISASVTRLDEATVDVNGEARAKSSLAVEANGSIAGFVAESDGSTSKFRIHADTFSISNSAGQNGGEPFTIDTTTGQIKFTGNVTFTGTPVDTALQEGQAASDVNSGSTTINGGKITTGTIDADRFTGNTYWTGGWLRSQSFTPWTQGFQLKSDAAGTYDDPNIFGAYIRGSQISADSDITTATLYLDNLRIQGVSGHYGSVTSTITGGLFTGSTYGSGYRKDRVVSSASNMVVSGKANVTLDNRNFNAYAYLQYNAGSGWVTVDTGVIQLPVLSLGGNIFTFSLAANISGAVVPSNGTIQFRVTATAAAVNSTSYIATLYNT